MYIKGWKPMMMMPPSEMFSIFALLSLLGATAAPLTGRALGITYIDPDTLPLLTLPYATYQAQSYDSSNDIYVFANIRFAAPPLGDLRWAPPAEPLTESGIQNGSIGGTCYQSAPVEFALVEVATPLEYPQSEDCLFLDVYVPGAAVRNPSASSLPVLFWIYGGGFVFGAKDQYGPTLLETSKNSIIYVRTNYRLGAFGWLAGPTFQGEGGTANVGLQDQLAALQWTQSYISLLGGDPTTVTVMGESAGASSILHHITAKGGSATPPFSRAILQSPIFMPQYDNSLLNTQFSSFTTAAGCSSSSLSCLRGLPSSQLQTANIAQTALVQWGRFQYGPAVDGTYVQDLPGRELLKGNYAKELQLMIGHNSDEGLIFTDPTMLTDSQVSNWESQTFPDASSGVIAEINQYYPPPLEALDRYLTNFDRVKQIIAEGALDCNCLYLAHAYSNNTYNYRFSIPPAIHGLDLLFTFDPIALTLPWMDLNIDVPLPYAKGLQSYFISFAKHGDPNVERQSPTVEFPVFGTNKNIVDLTLLGFSKTTDSELPSDRCAFWQPAPYM